ncbi:transcription factor [Ganoderma sinense ZZ0214-1]|uniref:Transcription factor n=1 Tax=Ganoderma sinense ZZ0214-1 TaxID=1077348 RepID=A0A2G8RTP0_9APHY|nr:transcription factor [Ganoderma sinense ZZ0214-1]
MSTEASISSSKYSVPKLATDGSNWVTYHARMTVVQAAKGHMPHIRGTARKPPLPPPVERENPHVPPPATTAPPPAATTAPAGGKTTSRPPSPTTTTKATATTTKPTTDAYSHLTDEEYAELVEKMDTKFCAWEAKEADARALIYETLSDELFIEVQIQPTVKSLWEAVVTSCENKSLMYANAIRTRIQNTRCPESGDVRAHLALLLRERQNLAVVGNRLGDAEFAAIITNSMPESYHIRIQSILDISSIAGHTIPIEFLIGKLNEEYDRHGLNKANENALAAAAAAHGPGPSGGRSQIVCYNCQGVGHIARNCRRKGGGKEGQWPKPKTDDTANAAKAEANAATEKGFLALGNVVASALAAVPGTYVDVFDSGASVHISPYRERFVKFRELNPARAITTANGEQFLATGEGDVEIRVLNGTSTQLLTLRDVLYSPSVAFALVSIKRADEGGYTTIFEHGECRIVERSSELDIARIPLTNGLYQVVSRYVEVPSAAAALSASSTRPGSSAKKVLKISQAEFHRCVAHRSYKAARNLVLNEHATGVQFTNDTPFDEQCDICIQAKITRKAIPPNAHPAEHDLVITKYGEKFHSDTWDANAVSLGGNAKSMLFVDDATRYQHGFPLRSNADTDTAYLELEASVLTQTGTQIKWVHSDNGSEFIGLKTHLKEKGTHWSGSVPRTPEQNGVAERGHRVHREGVSAMLLDSGLPSSLWAHAYKHSVYIHNRMGQDVLGGKTPYEACFGVPPDLRHLHPWGAQVWVKQDNTRKLDPRARSGRFVGFSENHRDGIHVYWPDKCTVTVVRSYIWALNDGTEGEEGGEVGAMDVQSEGARIEGAQPNVDHGAQDVAEASIENAAETQGDDEGRKEVAQVEGGQGDEGGNEGEGVADSEDEKGGAEEEEEVIERAPEVEASGRGHRVKRASAYVQRIQNGEGTVDGRTTRRLPRGIAPGDIMGTVAALASPQEDGEHGQGTWDTPTASHDWTAAAHVLVAEVAGDPLSCDPRTLREAQEAPDWVEWEKAISVEMENLKAHGTYELVAKPHGAHVIGSKLVFHRKRNAEGAVTQHKVRVVAQGFAQVPGIEFDQTFAPVAKPSSLRLMIALAARFGWPMIQLDVKSAYLNGELDEVIYMRQPPGTAAHGEEHLVCLLKKSLYGLKQAGRSWYCTYREAMTALGMTRCEADHACFWQRNGESLAMVGTIVDDMLVTGTPDLVGKFRAGIKTRFTITDAGEVAWLLGIEVVRDLNSGTVRVAQRTAIDAVTRALHLEGAKPATTPIAVGGNLDRTQCPTTADAIADMAAVPYKQGVGICMYISVTTRPDIAHTVHRLAKYMANPGRAHWEALKRLVRYLMGTRELWLVYGRDSSGLAGFTDADWGTSDDARHSVCGYVYTFDGGAVSWSAKQQNVVALSSTEAEYIGITHAAKEAIWLRALLTEMVHPDFATLAVRLYSDNKGAMDLAHNNAFHARTKHIAIRYHFIREAVERGDVDLGYRRTEDNPADIFTKPVTRGRLEHLRVMFGLLAL